MPKGEEKRVKIVNILGSPRKNGTSGRIAYVPLPRPPLPMGQPSSTTTSGPVQYRGCQGFEAATRVGHCVLLDGNTPLLKTCTAPVW